MPGHGGAPYPSRVTPPFAARTTGRAAYTERLHLTWWMWLGALVLDLILGIEVWLAVDGLPLWAPFAVLLPLTAALLIRAGRIRIRVTAGEFQVDDARLPVAVMAGRVHLYEGYPVSQVVFPVRMLGRLGVEAGCRHQARVLRKLP